MGKLQEFLMANEENAQATAEVAVSGFPVPFTIKSITEGENKALRKSCQKVTFDKKTHQKTTDTDQDLYNNRLVIACTVDPNFKDADLQAISSVLPGRNQKIPCSAWTGTEPENGHIPLDPGNRLPGF